MILICHRPLYFPDPFTFEEKRPRQVSAALKAYAMLATIADKGAVRDLDQ